MYTIPFKVTHSFLYLLHISLSPLSPSILYTFFGFSRLRNCFSALPVLGIRQDSKEVWYACLYLLFFAFFFICILQEGHFLRVGRNIKKIALWVHAAFCFDSTAPPFFTSCQRVFNKVCFISLIFWEPVVWEWNAGLNKYSVDCSSRSWH